jgi:hypothetical protein
MIYDRVGTRIKKNNYIVYTYLHSENIISCVGKVTKVETTNEGPLITANVVDIFYDDRMLLYPMYITKPYYIVVVTGTISKKYQKLLG